MGRLVVWLGIANVFQLALGFVLYAVLGRWLGVAMLGEISFALAVVAIADMVAQGGMTSIITREAAARPKNDGSLLGTALGIRAIFALVAGGIVAAVAGPWAALLMAGTIGQAGVCILRAKLIKVPLAAANLLPNGLVIITVIPLAIYAPPSAVLALAAYACARVLAAVGQVLLARAQLVSPVSWAAARARKLIEESWPLWVSEMLLIAFSRIDILMMRAILPAGRAEEAIGWYQAARSLSDGGIYVMGAMVTVAFPLMSAMRDKSPARMVRIMKKIMGMGVLAGGAAMLGTLLLAPYVIRLAFGGEFLPSATALRILSLSFPIAVVNGVLCNLLVATGRQWSVALSAATMVAVNIAGNLWAIPAHSFNGAAAMAVLVQMVGLVQFGWLTRNIRNGRET